MGARRLQRPAQRIVSDLYSEVSYDRQYRVMLGMTALRIDEHDVHQGVGLAAVARVVARLLS